MERTILQVSKSGSQVTNCFCDGLAQHGAAVVFLSLFGTYNSVRSVWARLQDRYGSVTVGNDSITLNKDFRYTRIQTPLERGILHLVLVEEKATNQILNASNFYYLSEFGDFYSRLDRLCSVPFRKEWKDFLWEKGLENSSIQELGGFGVTGYNISTSEDAWSEIVIEGLKEGLIS